MGRALCPKRHEDSEDERLKTIMQDHNAKLLVITMRVELKGTDAQRGRWDAELDTDTAYVAMGSDGLCGHGFR